EILLGAVVPLFGIYLPKLVVDLVTAEAERGSAAKELLIFTLLMMVAYGVKGVVSDGKYHLYNNQRTNLLGMVFLKSLRIPYEQMEMGEMKKLYWKACNSLTAGDWSASSRMVTGTISIVTNILCFALYSTVIGTLNIGLLVAVVVLALLNYLLSIRQMKYEESLREESAMANKHYWCVRSEMGNAKAAKDVRIFGMNHWLIELRDVALGEMRAVNRKSRKKRSLYEKLGFVLSLLRDFGAYGFLLYQATEGRLDAGEFVVYFGALAGFSGFVSAIMSGFAELRYAANSTDYLRGYLELPEENREAGSRHIDELTAPLEIRFENVSFMYKEADEEEKTEEENAVEEMAEEQPEKEEAVTQAAEGKGKQIFKNLSFTIRAGEKVALVGINGAGKTTLVKLLCGMYTPDEGRILIGGIDSRELPKQELYQLFSVVFQEQLILPFTVGENLALDRIERVDEKRALAAIERAGLGQVFREREIGIRTYMTREMMEKGINLSGGEQQKFLLARALYKDAPILILDEPTAALDAIAESEVYESYNRHTEGKTALFISHRLASTRFSDRIFLLCNGEIKESGTHEELMKQGGEYARMYEVQSSYYQTEGED
ncbi:MAG: ABC transporter ATP-binding protein, partial [Lachnospiraceae bacterium]|nr:ABC transporter ATP-binding protein [Lachnospiraceae bacterium]